MPKLETLKIVHPLNSNYWLNINVKDFDASLHMKWDDREVSGISSEEKVELGVVSQENREETLYDMDWREVKAIAEDHGIAKPESGWEDAIPLILKAEYGAD